MWWALRDKVRSGTDRSDGRLQNCLAQLSRQPPRPQRILSLISFKMQVARGEQSPPVAV